MLADDKRKTYLSCTPKTASSFDKRCATEFLTHYGRQLFRRPLTAEELKVVANLSRDGTQQTGDFYKGLQLGLARLLGSAHFIFRVERSVPDSSAPAKLRLDDYSLATRLSFIMWNAPPDAELLGVAETGALRTASVLGQQVDRLIASPLLEQGVRAFFSDMFGFEQFEGLSKDQTIYPKFTSALAKSAQEQMLRTIVDFSSLSKVITAICSPQKQRS